MSRQIDEMNYRLCLALASSLLINEVIAPQDFEEIKQLLLSEFMPYISLLST